MEQRREAEEREDRRELVQQEERGYVGERGTAQRDGVAVQEAGKACFDPCQTGG